ncbi:MAG: hypothetical protein AAGA34_09575 [Pseudomonadota bacterium]
MSVCVLVANRRAHALFERLKARDDARIAAEDAARFDAERAPREEVTYPAPVKKPPDPPKPRKTVRTLKDDGFEADRWV